MNELSKIDEQIYCQRTVEQRLDEYQKKIEDYQLQINEFKESFNNNIDIFNKIEQFIQDHGMVSVRMKCDYAITLLHCNYLDEQFRIEFQQQNPTDYQRQIGQQLFELNLKLERTKADYKITRQHLLYNQSPSSYDPLQITLPNCFNFFLFVYIVRLLQNQMMNVYNN